MGGGCMNLQIANVLADSVIQGLDHVSQVGYQPLFRHGGLPTAPGRLRLPQKGGYEGFVHVARIPHSFPKHMVGHRQHVRQQQQVAGLVEAGDQTRFWQVLQQGRWITKGTVGGSIHLYKSLYTFWCDQPQEPPPPPPPATSKGQQQKVACPAQAGRSGMFCSELYSLLP